MGFPRRVHDPDAVLDYPMDWSAWLSEGDSLASATVTPADPAVTVADPVQVTGAVVVPRISGGTPGTNVDVRYHVVTTNGLEDDRSITLVIKER